MNQKEAKQVKGALDALLIAWTVVMPGTNFAKSHRDTAREYNRAKDICKKYEKKGKGKGRGR